MAVYPNPSTAPYTNPVAWDMEWKTLKSNFDDLGEEKRKQKWLYPRRNITLKYKAITKDQMEDLYEFYQARRGSYESFVWFESTGIGAYKTYSSEYVATGDDTTLVFNTPAINSSAAHDLNLDGAAINSTNYTSSAKGGANGEDKVTFVDTTAGLGPPTSTQRITYDFTGRLKITCRFAEDNLSWENFHDRIINTGVQLRGLLNE
jgi:hypothetical protein